MWYRYYSVKSRVFQRFWYLFLYDLTVALERNCNRADINEIKSLLYFLELCCGKSSTVLTIRHRIAATSWCVAYMPPWKYISSPWWWKYVPRKQTLAMQNRWIAENSTRCKSSFTKPRNGTFLSFLQQLLRKWTKENLSPTVVSRCKYLWKNGFIQEYNTKLWWCKIWLAKYLHSYSGLYICIHLCDLFSVPRITFDATGTFPKPPFHYAIK